MRTLRIGSPRKELCHDPVLPPARRAYIRPTHQKKIITWSPGAWAVQRIPPKAWRLCFKRQAPKRIETPLPMMHCCLGFQGKASEGSRAACLSGVKLTDWIGTGKRGRKKKKEKQETNKRRGLAVQTLKFPVPYPSRVPKRGVKRT